MNEQLERVEKMLSALLKSSNHIWWVGGYVYGRTSRDDPFIILYPAGKKLKEKVCRVYDRDLQKLPAFIDTSYIPADTADDPKSNPDRIEAEKKGIFHPCQPFQIVTYDGQDTRMGPERRFGDVLRISQQQAPAEAGTTAKTERPKRPATAQKPNKAPAARPASGEGDEALILPDYRQMALDAQTAAAFDYAAFMALKNGLYTEQSHITTMRERLIEGWKPGTKANDAMFKALETYRDKRLAALKRGDTAQTAHNFAEIEARNLYQRLMR